MSNKDGHQRREESDREFSRDRSAGLMTMPWCWIRRKVVGATKFSAASPGPPTDQQGYCIHTWIRIPIFQTLNFNSYVEPVVTHLKVNPPPGLVGWSVANKISPLGVVFESFSVWESRQALADYIDSAEVQTQVLSMKTNTPLMDEILFSTRQVNVNPWDLPAHESYSETRRFISKLKQGAFDACKDE